MDARQRLLLSVTVVSLSFAGCATTESCGHLRGAGSVVSQRAVPAHPFFYYRLGRYTALFSGEDVRVGFEDTFKHWGQADAARLLSEIRSDLPLKTDTDLFKYAFLDRSFSSLLDRGVANLMESGKAAIVVAEYKDVDGYLPTEIRLVRETLSNGDLVGRSFCTQRGTELLSVADLLL